MTDKSDELNQMPTEVQTAQAIQDELKQGKRSLSDFAKENIRIAPSKRQILQLPKDLLLKHNSLIFHKGSSLSSTQRKLVQERIAYGINRGIIKPEEVSAEINKLNVLIQGELKKNIDADSTHSEE